MSIREVLVLDCEKYRKVDRPSVFITYIKCSYFRYVFWLRLCHYLKRNTWCKYSLGIIPILILRHLGFKYGLFVDSNITIGPGLHIIHGGCVYINAKKIGSGFTVYQGVTLGDSLNRGVPTVGNNVSVFAGAKVIGDVVLGDGCKVAANAVVTKDVSANAVVMGVPAKEHV